MKKGNVKLRHEGGYTLVELLVATTLMPMVMIVVGTIYLQIIKQHNKGMKQLDLVRQGTNIVEITGNLIRNAYGNGIIFKDIVDFNAWAGREIVVGIVGSENWSRVYMDVGNNILYYQETKNGVNSTYTLTSAVQEVRFTYTFDDCVDANNDGILDCDNSEPAAVNMYLCLSNDESIDPVCFTSTTKWRKWATWDAP